MFSSNKGLNDFSLWRLISKKEGLVSLGASLFLTCLLFVYLETRPVLAKYSIELQVPKQYSRGFDNLDAFGEGEKPFIDGLVRYLYLDTTVCDLAQFCDHGFKIESESQSGKIIIFAAAHRKAEVEGWVNRSIARGSKQYINRVRQRISDHYSEKLNELTNPFFGFDLGDFAGSQSNFLLYRDGVGIILTAQDHEGLIALVESERDLRLADLELAHDSAQSGMMIFLEEEPIRSAKMSALDFIKSSLILWVLTFVFMKRYKIT